MKYFVAFFLFNLSIHAQTSVTKALFYNLPIDKTKADVVDSIKSDTVLFHVVNDFYSKNRFLVSVQKNPENLPKPFILPTLNVIGAQFYRDTVLTKGNLVHSKMQKRHFLLSLRQLKTNIELNLIVIYSMATKQLLWIVKTKTCVVL